MKVSGALFRKGAAAVLASVRFAGAPSAEFVASWVTPTIKRDDVAATNTECRRPLGWGIRFIKTNPKTGKENIVKGIAGTFGSQQGKPRTILKLQAQSEGQLRVVFFTTATPHRCHIEKSAATFLTVLYPKQRPVCYPFARKPHSSLLKQR